MNGDIGQSIGHDAGHLKDNNQVVLKDNFSASIGAFLMSDVVAFAALKSERLASAVYLVSGLLSDNEPIKWSVRKIVTEIISDIGQELTEGVSLNSKGQSRPAGRQVENISSKIFQITSMLRVAWTGGLVSKMNYEILTSEYIKLNDFLIKKFGAKDDSNQIINKSFFVTGELSSIEERIISGSTSGKYLGEEFVGVDAPPEGRAEPLYARRDFVKDISSKGHLSDKKEFTFKNISSGSMTKTRALADIVSGPVSDRNKRERHDKTLSAMSPGISYSVSEILGIIGGTAKTCEKTIQRDLQQLVSTGRLKKTGERRWSRYSLA